MDVQDSLNCLQFHDDLLCHEDVNPVTTIEIHSLVLNR